MKLQHTLIGTVTLMVLSVFVCKLTSAQYCCPQIQSGLLAYYSFCGNAYDESGNGNQGTVNSAALTANRFGNLNSAYQFNGSTSYIAVPDDPSLRLSNTDFTISAWVFQTSQSTTQDAIITKRTSMPGNGYILNIEGSTEISPGHVNFQVAGGSDPRALSTSAIPLNSWQNIIVTYTVSSLTVKIYLNGVLNSTTTGIPSPPASITAAMWIGNDVSGNPYSFHGKIDDVAFYNRVLTNSEIQQLQLNNARCSCLIASYMFSGNAADSSGNSFNGTVVGAVLTTNRFGNSNSAYQFSATSDHISVPDNSLLRLNGTDFTISAWVYQTSLSTTQDAIVTKRTTAPGNGYILNIMGSTQVSAGHVNYQVAGGSDPRALSASVVPLNAWEHIVVTYTLSSSTARIYLNGILNSTTTGIPSPLSTTTAALWIGNDVSGSPYPFHGKIDDVQMYNCALSDSEIAVLYSGTTGIHQDDAMDSHFYLSQDETTLTIHHLFSMKESRGFQVYDIMGKSVSEEMSFVNAETQQINISNLSPGIYFLVVKTNAGLVTKKFLKE